eukprot:CAMPEP_0174838746 /NCGR_PEP_ID=MMETSP1114-20130205/7600_1 /TAXON_ID=312471 /ORGANISM="Neobodo designis, Strain CCAP 1951/1" /LENGTH=185 /DNA_ID=CAMNT_0016072851 /DNA_START=45 /DNA_END=602 /DNA_ORIENTATION=+
MASVPQPDESTLDEPVIDTLCRDLRAIGRKVAIVALPMLGGENELRDWDLWGPLVLCMILAMILGGSAGSDQGSLVFVAVFIAVSLGSAVVTLNAKFLGARLSFFQIVCVLGYCTAPHVIAAMIALFVKKYWYVKLALAVLAFAWSTYGSLRFFRGVVPDDRQALVVYPLGLFYFFLAWMLSVGI